MIADLVKRAGMRPAHALGIMAVEENNYRAAKILGCSAFAVSVMRSHMTEVVRLLLPKNYYRHIMGSQTKEVLQIESGQMLELVERRN